MDTSKFLDHLKALPWYYDQIVHREDIPSRSPTYGDLEWSLHPDLQHSLESIGVHSLYSHQSEAVTAVRRRKNVIVSTLAASGKSLYCHLPVLDPSLGDRNGRALFLFPTKALAQDQSNSLQSTVKNEVRPRWRPW